jgi:hypothetical protein
MPKILETPSGICCIGVAQCRIECCTLCRIMCQWRGVDEEDGARGPASKQNRKEENAGAFFNFARHARHAGDLGQQKKLTNTVERLVRTGITEYNTSKYRPVRPAEKL